MGCPRCGGGWGSSGDGPAPLRGQGLSCCRVCSDDDAGPTSAPTGPSTSASARTRSRPDTRRPIARHCATVPAATQAAELVALNTRIDSHVEEALFANWITAIPINARSSRFLTRLGVRRRDHPESQFCSATSCREENSEADHLVSPPLDSDRLPTSREIGSLQEFGREFLFVAWHWFCGNLILVNYTVFVCRCGHCLNTFDAVPFVVSARFLLSLTQQLRLIASVRNQRRQLGPDSQSERERTAPAPSIATSERDVDGRPISALARDGPHVGRWQTIATAETRTIRIWHPRTEQKRWDAWRWLGLELSAIDGALSCGHRNI